MAYHRTYYKEEVKKIIENQGWESFEHTGNKGCTTIHVGVKGDGSYFGQFDNFDSDGKDVYVFSLTVNA